MVFKDLSNNENIPLEERIKHLEREAAFVREYAISNNTWKAFCILCSISSAILSLLSLFIK